MEEHRCPPCCQAKSTSWSGSTPTATRNVAAIVEAATGGVVEHLHCSTDAMGYKRALAFADLHAPGRRVWAIEGTGSFGSGLTTFLLENGEWVVEIDRPARPARRDGAKTDELDAVRAAREALSRDHLAAPRARGTAKPSGSCSPPDTARSSAAPKPSDS